MDRLTEELKIQAEVLEHREKDIRQTNLVLIGLSSQKTGKDLVAEVETSLGQLIKVDLKEKVEHAFRLKRRNEHAKPAILVRFKDRLSKIKVMQNARQLKGSALFVSDDLTPKQKMELLPVVRQERAKGNKAFIRNGKVYVYGKPLNK